MHSCLLIQLNYGLVVEGKIGNYVKFTLTIHMEKNLGETNNKG